jgi:uncharacterized protein (DUF1778 family)
MGNSKNVEAIRYTMRFTAQGKRLIARAAAVCGVPPQEFLYRIILNGADAIVGEERRAGKKCAV